MKKITSLHEIEKITNGDAQIMKELLAIFIRESSIQIQKLQEYFSNKNWSELKKIVHKIKSALMLVGMADYRSVAEDLEYTAGTDLKKTKEQIDKLIIAMTQALQELNAELKKIS